jgi:glyoxylase-like metal-dependent hydrolase (beta-lactamase superfamily II)
MTRLTTNSLILLLGLWLIATARVALAAEGATQIGKDLYACISTNDASANSTFLVGKDAILLVDSGLNETEAGKCLAEIRTVSPLPIRYVVNTHYHLDHQGGNHLYAGEAVILTTAWTRQRTLEMLNATPPRFPASVTPATITFEHSLTIHLAPYTAEVISNGPGHTLADAYVYFPQQKAIATGDLFLNGSCPAMDQGSVHNWIGTLNSFLQTGAEVFVPGHFAVGNRQELTFFRDYLADLSEQVAALAAQGMTLQQVKQKVKPGKYATLRQLPKYHATFADNAASIYEQIHHP